jgi:hypothetical protein
LKEIKLSYVLKAIISNMIRFWLLLFSFLSCKISFSQPEDLGEIYSIGIRFRLNQLERKKVFVADTVTDNKFSMSTRQCAMVFKKFFYYKDSSGILAIDSLDSINPGNIKNTFRQYKYIRLISIKANNKIFSKGISKGWSKFYDWHASYAGIVFLSPVYFNQQHTKAIYQLSFTREPCGNGNNSLIFLERCKNGKWYKSLSGK